MDFYELFTLDEFGKYQSCLVEELSSCLVNAINDSVEGVPKAVQDVAIRIIKLPYKLHKADVIKKLEVEAIARFQTEHIKQKIRQMDSQNDTN
jgi:hypothetical protein